MHLSGIFVYPIKACGGVSLNEADVVERGLAADRRYMLVERGGTFVSQREEPRLCRVKVELGGAEFRVGAPGASPLTLPRAPAPAALTRASYRLWDSVGEGLRSPEGSRWFSELLGYEVSLLYMPDDERRLVNPQRALASDIVSFADGYPLLVISEASLADLNARLPEPVGMRRFRPNLVLSGCEAYAEDTFARVRIGSVSFRGVKRCERCVVTTLDPDSGVAGKEPLRTLSLYRREAGKVWFGMNLVHDGPGTLRVGDEAHLP